MTSYPCERTSESVIIATSISSIVSTFITNPLEVAKLNYQYLPLTCPYYPHQNYQQLVACNCSRFSVQGSLQSLKIALPQVLFSNLLYMPLYERVRERLIKKMKMSPLWSTFISSIASRAVVTISNVPIQSLRIRLSNEIKNKQINFHGFRITMVRDLVYSALFWSILEYYRNRAVKGEYRAQRKSNDFTWKNFSVNLIPGFVIASMVSALTTPLDTLKTRVQSEGKTNYLIVKGISDIYKAEGLPGLFAGVQWRVVKNSLHSSIYIFLYEWYLRSVACQDVLIANIAEEEG